MPSLARHLPNLVSAARIVLAPYILNLLWNGEFGAALAWFAIAGASDGIDGYLARKLGAESKLGAQLDPIGDKLLLSGAFLVLALRSDIPLWLAGLVLGRDVLILAGALTIAAIFKSHMKKLPAFPPSQWGKWSTTFQILYILITIAALGGLLDFGPGELLREAAGWVTVLLTVISGLDYVRRGAGMLRESG